MDATGTFDVTASPSPPFHEVGGVSFGRMRIDKVLAGDLVGTSLVEMLTAGTPVAGSAAYVALEHVSGTLHGRTGAFVLQHSATMMRGEPALAITVVPDSGTGELSGIAGTFTIRIEEGEHFYTFDYQLA